MERWSVIILLSDATALNWVHHQVLGSISPITIVLNCHQHGITQTLGVKLDEAHMY